jgi:hypothetical protein
MKIKITRLIFYRYTSDPEEEIHRAHYEKFTRKVQEDKPSVLNSTSS